MDSGLSEWAGISYMHEIRNFMLPLFVNSVQSIHIFITHWHSYQRLDEKPNYRGELKFLNRYRVCMEPFFEPTNCSAETAMRF